MSINYVIPPYRYAAPLRRTLIRAGVNPMVALPPDAYSLIINGNATAGLVPIRMLIRGDLSLAPGPMVHSDGETMSVIVVSRRDTPLVGCGSIAVSPESRSAAAYLSISLAHLGIGSRMVTGSEPGAAALLSLAPCALVLGDEALRSRYSFHIVVDVGVLVRDVLGINPVYAVTGSLPGTSIDLSRLTPVVDQEDVMQTAKSTGIEMDEAKRYHELIKLNYDEGKARTAMKLLLEHDDAIP